MQSKFSFTGCLIRNRPYGLSSLAVQLSTLYMQNLQTPIVNETEYTGPIDLELNVPLNNPELVNKELEKYGLSLEREIRTIEHLIIKDRS